MATAPQAPSKQGNVVGQDTAAPIHSWHLTLSDGRERDVKGVAREVDHCGSLSIRSAQGAYVVTYAPGQWHECELERQDDRG